VSAPVLEALCKLPAAKQIDSSTLVRLMNALARNDCSMQALCKLPAAMQIDCSTLTCLLKMAAATFAVVEQHNPGRVGYISLEQCHLQHSIQALCQLPAAEQLSGSEVSALLAAAVEGGGEKTTDVLCQLPAAKQLRRHEVLQLLQLAATAKGRGDCAEPLCSLSGAQQLSRKDVRMLLGAAELFGSKACL
jgi:hypothetical protein